MRPRLLEELRPLCPVCRSRLGAEHPVRVAEEWRADGEHLLEGALHCTHDACRMEYPVVEGVPLLLADLRTFVQGNLAHLLERRDLSPGLESLLGDCAGPSSPFDVTRQHLSQYGFGHFGDRMEGAVPGDAAAGAPGRILARGLELAGRLPEGPVLDVGCALGRASLEAAARTGRTVVGVDRHGAMLRAAAAALRDGVARFPLRRVGMVYDPVEAPARFEGSERVDFWAADAAALPFAAGSFALVASLQVLDCVPSPREHLAETARVLAPGGAALLATPYDWSPGATPVEAWLGGHSQRGEGRGRSEPVLRSLLTPGAHPASVEGLVLEEEEERLPWEVRLHDRSRVRYDVHLAVARA